MRTREWAPFLILIICMVIHFRQYFWDFDKMYSWADFDLRMNHAAILRDAHKNYKRPEHIKANLKLIEFWEIRWIRGDLKMWSKGENQWVSTFNQAPELQAELNKLYLNYVAENALFRN